MDATRMADGIVITLKHVSRLDYPHEVDIATHFSTEPWVSHDHNHCVPAYEVLPVPGDEDSSFIIMPLLREFDDPPFETVGEVIESLRQLTEVSLSL